MRPPRRPGAPARSGTRAGRGGERERARVRGGLVGVVGVVSEVRSASRVWVCAASRIRNHPKEGRPNIEAERPRPRAASYVEPKADGGIFVIFNCHRSSAAGAGRCPNYSASAQFAPNCTNLQFKLHQFAPTCSNWAWPLLVNANGGAVGRRGNGEVPRNASPPVWAEAGWTPTRPRSSEIRDGNLDRHLAVIGRN